MIRSPVLASLILVAWIAPAALAAQPETSPAAVDLTLADVVRLLGSQNPKLIAEREAIAAARADRRTAAAFPNPKLGISHQSPNGQQTLFTGDRQEQINLEIPILIPGQRSSRIAKAEADLAAAQAHVTANTAALTADACTSFMRLLAAQQRAEILSNSVVEVDHLRETIAGRNTGGAASPYDLARVEVEAGVLSSRLATARAEMTAEAGTLAALLAITNALPVATGPLQAWGIPQQYLLDPSTLAVASPTALAAARDTTAAIAGVKAASRARWPEFSIEGGRAWTRHPFGSADFVGVNVEIPIFDTRRGPLEKARSDARAASARQSVATAEAEATLRQLAETIQRRTAAVDRYRTDIAPRLTHLKEMAADAYQMGRHSILELLDAEQARREVVLENVETLSGLIEAQIRFLSLTGALPAFLSTASTK